MAFLINATVEPHYPLKRSQLKKAAIATLEAVDIKSDTRVDISVIGNRKMRQLNREFRNKDESTDVLAFPFEITGDKSKKFITPSDPKYLNLGDVIISYPKLLERAAKENMLVDEMANLLVVHGILHLLGYDHEKPHDALVMEKLEDQILQTI